MLCNLFQYLCFFDKIFLHSYCSFFLLNCGEGVAHCLGELYSLFGRRITSGLTETTSLAAKLMKFYEVLSVMHLSFVLLCVSMLLLTLFFLNGMRMK